MAMITAKLAKIRWRNVQFFTVNPRGHSNDAEYSRGYAMIRLIVETVLTAINKKTYM